MERLNINKDVIFLRWTDAPVGENIVDVVLSIDAQVKRMYNQNVALANYSKLKPTLDSFDKIGYTIEGIEKAVKDLEGHRGEYLRSMAKSFRYYNRSLQGDKIPYDELMMGIQELPAYLIPEENIAKLKEIIDIQLSEIGYKGDVREKVTKWLQDTNIKPENVVAYAKSIVKSAKTDTLSRVVGLPEDEGIESIKSIRGVYWSGYSAYVGNHKGTLTFNIDRPWSEPIFTHVLTHEAYPGHQTFYCRWDYLYEKGELPLEAAYYLINSPTNALFEGGPENALHFLGWDCENENTPGISNKLKKQFVLAKNFSDMQRMAQTNACYLVSTGKFEKDEAIKYLQSLGMLGLIEAENTYRFFTDPIKRMYYPCYYYGRWMIGKAYDLVPQEKRSEYYKILYDTPHTTKTFIKAISNLTGTIFNPFEI